MGGFVKRLFVVQLCPTLFDPMDCSTPGFPVLHYLLDFAQTHVHWVSDAIPASYHLSPPSPALNLSQHRGVFPVSQLFTAGGQSIGASASATVFSINIQDWFPLGLIGWISLQSKRLSRFFSHITVQKHIYYMYYLSISWMESIYFIRILKPYGERHPFIDFSCSCTSYRMCLDGKVPRTFTWYIFQVWISRK